MIETGKILQQRYRIDRQIGQGGMGAVYVATDERFNSTVAIKETLCMDDNYRKAIEREARLLNSLKHSALPRVSDHFIEANGQFLVMEFIPGEDLGSMIEREGKRFPVEQVLTWADQLLGALEYLHNQSNPVIHRDIKPQNLKITARGQIVLLDFGLAKGNPTDAANHTAGKSIFGFSRSYASLEQIQGTGTDPRSDLYSLAATLYHLMTGRPPEDALTRAMAVLSNRPDPLIPANAIEPSIPAGVAAILLNAMDLNESKRPPSALAMRQMLREHERYAEMLPAFDGPAPATDADIFAQKTKLMPQATRAVADRSTQAKTAVMPEYVSQETSVRTPLAQMPAGTRRVGWLAASALAVLAGGVAFYAYEHSLFMSAEPESAPAAASFAPVVQQEEPAAEPAETNVNAAVPEVPEEPITTVAAKPRPAVKESRPSTEKKKQQAPETSTSDSEEIVVNGKTIKVGDVKIDPRTLVIPETYIDENGVKRRIFRTGQPPPMPPKVDPRHYMSPEQIKKLEELKRKRGVPAPSPTP